MDEDERRSLRWRVLGSIRGTHTAPVPEASPEGTGDSTAQFTATPRQAPWSEGPDLVVLNASSGFKKQKRK